uniref:hypothetical protein n=1 Tax=Acetatifactor sp. TaxID=1872090 RepID=UPI004057927E
MKYNFVSENTTNLLSLHDCDCSHFYYQNDSLIFEMEWMEVLANHPLNPNLKAHQSGNARIVLESPQIVECVLYENRIVDGEHVARRIAKLEEIDFKEVEFLEYNELQTDSGFKAKMFIIFNERDADFHSIALEVQFQKSIVMWDELKEESWFED